ncbi:hypothetical protein [Mesorhizobium sp. M0323]|uniref:hypothetical protein n=1 Tax=unclassified Mesorhizobium TaxID=325217 RepID=UPI00333C3BAE
MQANTAAAIRVDLASMFVSLELSRSKWLVNSLRLVPGMARPPPGSEGRQRQVRLTRDQQEQAIAA